MDLTEAESIAAVAVDEYMLESTESRTKDDVAAAIVRRLKKIETGIWN